MPVYKGKCDPLMCRSYRAIKLLEKPMRVLEKRARCQLMACSLASCLEREPLMIFYYVWYLYILSAYSPFSDRV